MVRDEHPRFDAYHERVLALTGDAWCPYPSDAFIDAVLARPDDEARALIEERRGYSFPVFLAGEPQAKSL